MKLKNKTVPFMTVGYRKGSIFEEIIIYFFNKESGVTYYGTSYSFVPKANKWQVNEKAAMKKTRVRANFGEIEDNVILLREAIKILFEGEKRKPLY